MKIVPIRTPKAQAPAPTWAERFAPRDAGYRVQYNAGTRCPVCDCGSFIVGRQSAECSHCGTPLPLATLPDATPPVAHYPLAGKVAIIVGASVALWTLVLSAAVLLVRAL